MIVALNLAITLDCFWIAAIEASAGHYPSAAVYISFGLGYASLGWLYHG